MPHLKPVGHQSTNWIVPWQTRNFLEKLPDFFEKTQRMHQKRKGNIYTHTESWQMEGPNMMGVGKCVSFQTSPSCWVSIREKFHVGKPWDNYKSIYEAVSSNFQEDDGPGNEVTYPIGKTIELKKWFGRILDHFQEASWWLFTVHCIKFCTICTSFQCWRAATIANTKVFWETSMPGMILGFK